MDRISINNLFPSSNNFQPLDVNSLYNINEQRTKNKINFNIDKLVSLREERRRKIFVQYEKIFNMCLNKINMANGLNKNELVYYVPEAVYGYFDYNSTNCLEYIEGKLRQMKLETLILDNTSIYISWENLAKKIKKK